MLLTKHACRALCAYIQWYNCKRITVD